MQQIPRICTSNTKNLYTSTIPLMWLHIQHIFGQTEEEDEAILCLFLVESGVKSATGERMSTSEERYANRKVDNVQMNQERSYTFPLS